MDRESLTENAAYFFGAGSIFDSCSRFSIGRGFLLGAYFINQPSYPSVGIG